MRRLRLRDCKVGQVVRLNSGEMYAVVAYLKDDIFTRHVRADLSPDYSTGPFLLSGMEEIDLV